MNGLRSALGFLTILLVAPRDAGGLAAARGWFPAAALLLGLALALLDLLMHSGYPLLTDEYRQFPPLLSAAILVVAMVVLTRALHLDGFMDCCDALFGGFDRERRQAILRDSHVGAFAVVGVAALLLLKVAAIMALPPAGASGCSSSFPACRAGECCWCWNSFRMPGRRASASLSSPPADAGNCWRVLSSYWPPRSRWPARRAGAVRRGDRGGSRTRAPGRPSCWAASQAMSTAP